MSTDTLPPLREVIRRHDLGARKSLGQNFLLDLNLTRKIARASGPLEGMTVIEVGPGPGGLTRGLLMEGAGRVIAIERDARCLPALEEIAAAYPGRLEIVEGDALDVDYRALVGHEPARIVANLPYNVGTRLLTGWLSTMEWPPFWESLTLMFQKEVAERIAARPSTPDWGRLSVLAQWRSKPHILFEVPPQAFVPAPKVTSAVVQIVPTAAPEGVALGDLETITARAFAGRRKMLRQSLKGLPVDVPALLLEAGVPDTLRADALDLDGYLRLARAFSALRGDGARTG
ncbi:MAG: 16S rRNA (adenine(1518)-N(6)/adenine(1519)-N(6))-dimethyltransferase RsmA [Alphaproteobacteria bacterium]|nr:16S rRNA (adenine(1518)-N(6)/adenine(1519)-N(6))-dimethyltransferase RsmA [Alphaproteobacteria bacterium]MDX5368403.1 16S rRNA (adenine(1518)-N(6)/adenine(1519)-N(6))-dimethyltransferase RsmA [Alphaproteobacteria bacterium]MDX5463198.1 16S rRNA (adenine(1518)-N(6)/adenine(1519)-N(6))-dimethyltransferase RsmA [Alphaproteobacteria bacterium]